MPQPKFAEFYRPPCFSRELRRLRSIARLLDQARLTTRTCSERLRLLATFSVKLDQFFERRWANLKHKARFVAGLHFRPCSDGDPDLILHEVARQIHGMIAEQRRVLKEQYILPHALVGIALRRFDTLVAAERQTFQDYFSRSVYPLLTPLVIDSGHPFPHVRHLSVNTALMIERRERGLVQQLFAVVQAPSALRKIVSLPDGNGRHIAVNLEDLIGSNLSELFGGFRVMDHTSFRVTRNLLASNREGKGEEFHPDFDRNAQRRIRGEAVRLEIANTAGTRFVQMLQDALDLDPNDVYRVAEPIDLTAFTELYPTNNYDF